MTVFELFRGKYKKLLWSSTFSGYYEKAPGVVKICDIRNNLRTIEKINVPFLETKTIFLKLLLMESLILYFQRLTLFHWF